MPRKTRTKRAPAARRRATPRAKTESSRTLARRLARAVSEGKTERARHARELKAVQQASDRQIAGLVQEIGTLRHHEARAEALMRLLAERERALEAQAARIAELETLLRNSAT